MFTQFLFEDYGSDRIIKEVTKQLQLVHHKINQIILMRNFESFFVKSETDRTRYYEHKLYVKYSRSNKINNVFSLTTVPIWIALGEVTRSALTLNMLQNILDRDPSFC